MNSHLSGATGTFWRNRYLIKQLICREVVGRYRGSVLGLLWSFFQPLLMLAVFTFVFGVVFQARWGETGTGSHAEFALILFAGLIVFNFFSEVVNRAPGLIVGNVNYVKKVVFPLEILPLVAAGASLFHAFISVAVLLVAYVLIHHTVPWTVVWLPIVLLPLVFLATGIAWFLASLGVFLRDVSQVVGILTTALLFLSPIFFPASALPDSIQPWIFLNPLGLIIEQTRAVMIWGEMPDWRGLSLYGAVSLSMAAAGFFWFQKTRKGFADVL
jgi:lipopolysaccharide transport system permease protein